MNCPACNKILKNIQQKNQAVELCESCGGFWLEHDQLHEAIKNLASNEKISYREMQNVLKGKRFSGKRRKQLVRKCPCCSIDMSTFNFFYNFSVFLDKCPFCKGIWIDKSDRVDLTQHLRENTETNSYVQILTEAEGQFLKKQEGKRKLIAVAVAIAYLVLAFGFGEKGAWLHLSLFLTFPILCIFFGRKADSLTKFSFDLPLGSKIIRITPGAVIVVSGWGLLFLPLFFALGKVAFG